LPSLQIRDLPEPLHCLLQHRARLHKRSLSQQALERIEQRWQQRPALHWPEAPEELIRADRDR
jgi:plasmid stability protein